MRSYLGLDIGTSGVRAILIDHSGATLATSRVELPASKSYQGMICQRPEDWWQATLFCVTDLANTVSLSSLQAIAIDGTSTTTLLTDMSNTPISPALMYNDSRSTKISLYLESFAKDIPASSRSSALAKALWLYRNYAPDTEFAIQQQADWILAQFTAKPGNTDWNNALKLGYDPDSLSWPAWLSKIDIGKGKLPEVHQPGKPVAGISQKLAAELGIPTTVVCHAGTTDSIAAFIASGAGIPGDATTSLGSTLALKLCTTTPITSNKHGIYSHRLDKKRWLVGGASNTGGTVLKQLFSEEELIRLSKKINTEQNTPFNYYPLPSVGERFPYPDPEKLPLINPVPDNRAEFLQAIFESIANIEKLGYELFEELGAGTVRSIRSSGGGAKNPAWTRIRERITGRPFLPSTNTEAAYGSAMLAAGKL